MLQPSIQTALKGLDCGAKVLTKDTCLQTPLDREDDAEEEDDDGDDDGDWGNSSGTKLVPVRLPYIRL